MYNLNLLINWFSCQEPLSNLHALSDINTFLQSALVPSDSHNEDAEYDHISNDSINNDTINNDNHSGKKEIASVDVPIASDLLDKLVHTFSIVGVRSIYIYLKST